MHLPQTIRQNKPIAYTVKHTSLNNNLKRARRYLSREILGLEEGKIKGKKGLLSLAIDRLRDQLQNENPDYWGGATDRLIKLLPYIAPTATEELRLAQGNDPTTGMPGAVSFTVYLQDRGFPTAIPIEHLGTALEVTCSPVQYDGSGSPGQDTPV